MNAMKSKVKKGKKTKRQGWCVYNDYAVDSRNNKLVNCLDYLTNVNQILAYMICMVCKQKVIKVTRDRGTIYESATLRHSRRTQEKMDEKICTFYRQNKGDEPLKVSREQCDTFIDDMIQYFIDIVKNNNKIILIQKCKHKKLQNKYIITKDDIIKTRYEHEYNGITYREDIAILDSDGNIKLTIKIRLTQMIEHRDHTIIEEGVIKKKCNFDYVDINDDKILKQYSNVLSDVKIECRNSCECDCDDTPKPVKPKKIRNIPDEMRQSEIIKAVHDHLFKTFRPHTSKLLTDFNNTQLYILGYRIYPDNIYLLTDNYELIRIDKSKELNEPIIKYLDEEAECSYEYKYICIACIPSDLVGVINIDDNHISMNKYEK